jgi:hypothetical protein
MQKISYGRLIFIRAFIALNAVPTMKRAKTSGYFIMISDKIALCW